MIREIVANLTGDLSLMHLPIWVGHLQEAIAARNAGAPFNLTVDLRETRFVSASSAAALAALLTWLRQGSLERGTFLRPKAEVDGWMTRMNFYEVLGTPVGYPFHRWPADGRFHELLQLKSESQVDGVVQRFGEILNASTVLRSEVVNDLKTIAAELIENVFHHAKSPNGAFVCAQCYPSRRRVEIGIADCGRGIRASLSENARYRDKCETEVEAIQAALQPRVTGRPSYNSGWGLTWASEVARENHGNMTVFSRNAVYNVEHPGDSCVNAPEWPGTIVGFRFDMDRPVDLAAIMKRLDPEGLEFHDLFGE